MYEKIGISLSKIPDTEVHVVGYGNELSTDDTPIKVYGLGIIKRLSLKRLLAPWRVFKILRSVQPEVVIACTHELLLPFVLYKVMHPKTKLVYDLQENYFLNILHTRAFPSFLRWPLALWVRTKERLAFSFFDTILAAEACYLKEMPFIRSKTVVVANKGLVHEEVVEARAKMRNRARTCLLFSGTVSPEYGIYEAIDLVEALHDLDPTIYLRIVGYCAQESERLYLQEYIREKPFVLAASLDKPMPHSEILKAIGQADWGLIAYRDNAATRNRVPTKLYEYMSYKLPVLSTHNEVWEQLITEYDAGLSINYEQTHVDLLIRILTMPDFYRSTAHPGDLAWEGEEVKLVKAII